MRKSDSEYYEVGDEVNGEREREREKKKRGLAFAHAVHKQYFLL